MSVALMGVVWRMDLPPTDKMVLLALADAANDDGVAWPAVSSAGEAKLPLCRKTSLSERTVQGAIRRLEKAGLLECRQRPGRSTVYLVKPYGGEAAPDPRSRCTPAADAPPQQMHQTPAAAADDPSRNHQSPQKNKSSEGAHPPRKPAGRSKVTPLPIGWPVPPIAALGPAARALAERWPEGAYAAVAEKFVSHWRGHGGAKADWDAAWGKWVISEAPEVARAVKAGVVFSAGGGAGAAVVPGGRDSCRVALGIRELMRAGLPPATFTAWLHPMHFTVRGGQLIVSSNSRYRVDRVKQDFRDKLRRAAGALEVVFVVEAADG